MFFLAFYNAEYDKQFFIPLKYLFLPILLLFIATYHKMPHLRAKVGDYQCFTSSIITAALVAYISFGQVLFVNAHFGSKELDVIEGKIIRKRSPHKSGQLLITVLRKGTNEKTPELEVSFDEYHSLKRGDTYKGRWYIGSLGILFRISGAGRF